MPRMEKMSPDGSWEVQRTWSFEGHCQDQLWLLFYVDARAIAGAGEWPALTYI